MVFTLIQQNFWSLLQEKAVTRDRREAEGCSAVVTGRRYSVARHGCAEAAVIMLRAPDPLNRAALSVVLDWRFHSQWRTLYTLRDIFTIDTPLTILSAPPNSEPIERSTIGPQDERSRNARKPLRERPHRRPPGNRRCRDSCTTEPQPDRNRSRSRSAFGTTARRARTVDLGAGDCSIGRAIGTAETP